MNAISKYRTHIMGISIFLIMFHHMPGYLPPILDFIRVNGGIGVDVFLFLSGIGMYSSLKKNSNVKQFYIRRFLRIFPTYFIIVLLYNLLKFEDLNVVDCLWQLSTLGLWFYKSCYDWYIPALIILYLISPVIYNILIKYSITKWIIFPISLCLILLAYLMGFNYINFFFPRIPIFVLGFVLPMFHQYYDSIKHKNIIHIILILGLLGVFTEILLYTNFYINFRKGIIYFPYILIVPLFIQLSILFCNNINNFGKRIFFFVGSLTLEIYLIHLHLFEHFHEIHEFIGGAKVFTVFIMVISVILLSFLLHKTVSFLLGIRYK